MERPRPTVLLGLAAMVVLIGLNFIAVRGSNRGLDPTWGAALRFGAAGVLMAGYIAARRIAWPRGKALAGAALYGVFMFAAFFGFIYWGLVETPAAVGSTITATVPLLTLIVASVAGVERFTWSRLLGALVVIAGVALLFATDSTGGASPWRLAAVLAAAASMAIGTVIVKGFPQSHPAATNAVGMGVAFVLLLALSAMRRDAWGLPATAGVWTSVAYLVISSLVLFPLMVWVIREWSAAATAYAMVLAPLVTVPVGAWILDESVGLRFGLAAAVILVGVYVGALWPGRSKA